MRADGPMLDRVLSSSSTPQDMAHSDRCGLGQDTWDRFFKPAFRVEGYVNLGFRGTPIKGKRIQGWYTYNIVLCLLDVGRLYLTCVLYFHAVACLQVF